jgi:hypothetical protein
LGPEKREAGRKVGTERWLVDFVWGLYDQSRKSPMESYPMSGSGVRRRARSFSLRLGVAMLILIGTTAEYSIAKDQRLTHAVEFVASRLPGEPIIAIVSLRSQAQAKAALDRIAIPPEALERIVKMVSPRSSLIISDKELSPETAKDTDFIVVLGGEPQGSLKMRRRDRVTDAR